MDDGRCEEKRSVESWADCALTIGDVLKEEEDCFCIQVFEKDDESGYYLAYFNIWITESCDSVKRAYAYVPTSGREYELRELAAIMASDQDGDLDLRHAPIKSLPDNLIVRGTLDLSGSSIFELPNNIIVGGDCRLASTFTQKIPSGMIVGGSLDLKYSRVDEIPDNFTVNGSLDLRGTRVTRLPDNLIVYGSLDLRGVSIERVRINITVGGDVILDGENGRKLLAGFSFLNVEEVKVNEII